MTTAFAASTKASANIAPGLRVAVVEITWPNAYATASCTFDASVYGGFDTIYAIHTSNLSLAGYKVEATWSGTTVTPNLYYGNFDNASDGPWIIVPDTTSIGDNKKAQLIIWGV